jgi:predicted nucleic acid-binding protein
MVAYLMNLIILITSPDIIPEAIISDKFDNIFLALESENYAGLIISGDRHLIEVKEFNKIQIVTPSEAADVVLELV